MDKDPHAQNIIEIMKHSAPRKRRVSKRTESALKPQIQGHGNITGDVQISNSTVMLGTGMACNLFQRIAELELAVQELRADRR